MLGTLFSAAAAFKRLSFLEREFSWAPRWSFVTYSIFLRFSSHDRAEYILRLIHSCSIANPSKSLKLNYSMIVCVIGSISSIFVSSNGKVFDIVFERRAKLGPSYCIPWRNLQYYYSVDNVCYLNIVGHFLVFGSRVPCLLFMFSHWKILKNFLDKCQNHFDTIWIWITCFRYFRRWTNYEISNENRRRIHQISTKRKFHWNHCDLSFALIQNECLECSSRFIQIDWSRFALCGLFRSCCIHFENSVNIPLLILPVRTRSVGLFPL